MFAVTVLFQIKPGHMAEFMPLMVQNAQTSLASEDGCHQFDICGNPQDDQVFLYEIYQNRAAFDVHLSSEHFRTFDAAVADLVDTKHVQTYAEVAQ